MLCHCSSNICSGTISLVLQAPCTALSELSGAVARLASEDVDAVGGHELGDDLVCMRRLMDRLEAEFVRRVERFDRGRGALSEGAVSTVSWLRATCGLTGGGAADRVRMARMLGRLPRTTASFRAGRSSFANVALVARLAEEVGADAVAGVEETLVPAAEALDPGRMRILTAFTRHRLDADGALEADNRDHERRWFACDQVFGGAFVLRGELDAENGAVLKTALDALSSPSGPDDQRRGSQRRADALVELASRQLRDGRLPAVHGQRPHLTVTADAATLRRLRGAPPADVLGVGPVHGETARRLACDSVLTLAAVAGSGAPLSIGRASRTIPAAIRTALGVRDGGCRFPGCDRPLSWTDGHHIRHWADGGETRVDNLVSLCRTHHRAVHEQGWEISLAADGQVVLVEPTRDGLRAASGSRRPRPADVGAT
jgi:Domain of unknown function (DUF222)/HNH endonuclease